MPKKSIALFIFLLSLNCCIAQSKSQYKIELNPKCDSLTGYFFLLAGYKTHNKFYPADIRDPYYGEFLFGTKTMFNTDTLYRLTNYWPADFINFFDSLKIKYINWTDSFVEVRNSFHRNLRPNVQFKIDNGKLKEKIYKVFIRIKMSIFYNQSWVLDNSILYKMHFNEKGVLTKKEGVGIFYKPILYYKVIGE